MLVDTIDAFNNIYNNTCYNKLVKVFVVLLKKVILDSLK